MEVVYKHLRKMYVSVGVCVGVCVCMLALLRLCTKRTQAMFTVDGGAASYHMRPHVCHADGTYCIIFTPPSIYLSMHPSTMPPVPHHPSTHAPVHPHG